MKHSLRFSALASTIDCDDLQKVSIFLDWQDTSGLMYKVAAYVTICIHVCASRKPQSNVLIRKFWHAIKLSTPCCENAGCSKYESWVAIDEKIVTHEFGVAHVLSDRSITKTAEVNKIDVGRPTRSTSIVMREGRMFNAEATG